MKARAGYVLFAVLLWTAACGRAPEVVQGTVSSYDRETNVVVIEEESRGSLEVSLEGAEIGAEPLPGDVVRIACRARDGRLRATRVMNISRQSESAGKVGH
jgi:hypothetical protein